MKVKRVLVFGMTPNPGGMENVIMNYYRHIDRDFLQFDFLCYDTAPAYAEEIVYLGGKIFLVTGRRRNAWKNRKEMNTFFQSHHQDYIAVWENVNSLSDILPLQLAKKFQIPTRVIHSHNSQNMGGRLTKLLHTVNRYRIEKYATDFWACSQVASEWMFREKILNSKHFQIIHNAIDTKNFTYNETIRDRMRAQLGVSDYFVVGHVGRFHFQKNHEFLIDVFQEIRKCIPKSALLLIGQGDEEPKIREKVRQLGLTDSVKFLGIRSDIANLYQAMDIFVLPSRFEGLPVVGIEAQAAGLPCYFSDRITKDAAITNSCFYFSLQKSAPEWANYICKNRNNRNLHASGEIKRAGYDIFFEAHNLFFNEDR